MFPLSPRSVLALATAGMLGGSATAAPHPQDPTSDAQDELLVIRAKRVFVRPGKVLKDASVLVRGDRIVAVGTDVVAPEGTRALEGEVCCAGYLDAWSSLGVTPLAEQETRTDSHSLTLDAFDVYGSEYQRVKALRSGVVALRVQAAALAEIRGLGAVVSTGPGTDLDTLVFLNDANLSATVGATQRGRTVDVFDRIGQIDKLAGEIHDGIDYRQDEIEYRHDLEEWLAAIAEKEKELEKDFKKAKKDRDKEIEEAKEKGKEHKEKKYKEDNKPKPPKYDPEKEVLARVANGELPMVVHVNRVAELRELLATTREFDRLRLIVAGGTEALHVAEELAERRIPVIVHPAPLGTRLPDELDGHDLGLAGRLAEAGVTVLLGSGGGDAARDLPLLARLAIGHGLDREDAFAALTLEAARAFDLSDQLGSVARGRRAELLVLDGDPLGPNTSVRYVVSGGRVSFSPEDQ